VSVIGTLSSAVGGALIGLSYYVVVLVCGREASMGASTPAQWPLILVTALTGLLGSMTDSFLGATLQYSGQCSLPRVQFVSCELMSFFLNFNSTYGWIYFSRIQDSKHMHLNSVMSSVYLSVFVHFNAYTG